MQGDARQRCSTVTRAMCRTYVLRSAVGGEDFTWYWKEGRIDDLFLCVCVCVCVCVSRGL